MALHRHAPGHSKVKWTIQDILYFWEMRHRCKFLTFGSLFTWKFMWRHIRKKLDDTLTENLSSTKPSALHMGRSAHSLCKNHFPPVLAEKKTGCPISYVNSFGRKTAQHCYWIVLWTISFVDDVCWIVFSSTFWLLSNFSFVAEARSKKHAE